MTIAAYLVYQVSRRAERAAGVFVCDLKINIPLFLRFVGDFYVADLSRL